MNLHIKNIHVSVNKENILKGVNLHIKNGEVHAIMGPNGSGKSTLSLVLAGHPAYCVKSGTIMLNNENITHMSPHIRSKKGIFLAFQHPLEIPGVNNSYFLKTIVKTHLKYKNISSTKIMMMLEEYMLKLGMSSKFLKRDINEGFSGGEKKRNEILQMFMLKPNVSILDEIDSGLDLDALKFVAISIDKFLKNNPQSSLILVTHYSHLFKYIKPIKIHILMNGKIIKSGSVNLIKKLEQQGYQGVAE